jgi:NAD(P)-dependent dehydrogenase (short-subunit alcohol dehydrogenase family)
MDKILMVCDASTTQTPVRPHHFCCFFIQIRADCGSTEALGHAFQTALQTFGRVDIVVNNAALPETGGDFQTTCSMHLSCIVSRYFLPGFDSLLVQELIMSRKYWL